MTATTESTTHGAHGSHADAPAIKHEAHQQHPLKVYFAVWILLFVLSAFSYMVDYFDIHGYLRWFLIILFMMLKAGFIVAIFMHMAWERLALVLAILMPPLAVLVFMAILAFEGDYTFFSRLIHFVTGS
jgi:cytochrome c oxidase subunit IV